MLADVTEGSRVVIVLTRIQTEPPTDDHEPADEIAQDGRTQTGRQHPRAEDQHELLAPRLGVSLGDIFAPWDRRRRGDTMLHGIAQQPGETAG